MSNRRAISTLTLSYPIGSKDDPCGKEGITHLLEHMLVKSKAGDVSLIELCSRYGCEIHASTSKERLTLKMEGSRARFVSCYSAFIDHMAKLEACAELSADLLEDEKQVILNEMDYKMQDLAYRNRQIYFTERWNGTSLEHPVLGSATTLQGIGPEDLHAQFRQLLRAYPDLELVHSGREERAQLERLTANFLDHKAIVTEDEYRKALYDVMVYAARQLGVEHVSIHYCGSICRLLLSLEARQRLVDVDRKEAERIIGGYPGNPEANTEHLRLLAHDQPAFVWKEINRLLGAVSIKTISEGNCLAINHTFHISLVGSHHWCQLTNENHDQEYAAISIRPDPVIRQHVRKVTKALMRYVQSGHTADIYASSELGLISLFIRGSRNGVTKALHALFFLEPGKLEACMVSERVPESRIHSVQRVCDYYVHNNDWRIGGKPMQVTHQELALRFSKQLSNGISVVTSIQASQAYSDSTDHAGMEAKDTADKAHAFGNENTAPPFLIGPHEYIEIWPGTSYFAPDKYFSHVLWSLMSGMDGQMFRALTLETSQAYSHTFFSRELYDFGYMLLYAHCPDPKARNELGTSFRAMLEEIQEGLSQPMLEKAKDKIRLQREKSNRASAQSLIQMSANLLCEGNMDAYLSYKNQLDRVHPDSMHTFVSEMLMNSTIRWETEVEGNAELHSG
ncbi:insulinase family protein [Paenibacillus paeoniae]|uniref:Insulinase family protein n=1 Tax=Paenibacillus paeoniae TaxID=2292705 RepID=A0A371PFR9_9BACL|nr:insulinase family protein [Paenibacillus paeoniae]REK74240.1 insulinase family protein [Paenibacillus paeoniae]